MSSPLPTVLHLAVEYNDPYLPKTTKAVQSLVEATPMARHVVISLRRTTSRASVHFIDCGDVRGAWVFSYSYLGTSFGLTLQADMRNVATRVLAALREHHVRPDLVHSHKFTFEGIAGDEIARALDIPHIISVRGEVESKVLRAKPHYAGLYRRIAKEARTLFYVSAWYQGEFERRLGEARDRSIPLPNMVSNAKPHIAASSPGADFISVMDLTKWRRKGFPKLVEAFGSAAISSDSRLDIVGKSTEDIRRQLQSIIERQKLTSRVRLIGEVPHAELIRRLPEYRGFLLASTNETFGMSYIEALFAGVPILYSAQTGIDGYLDDFSVAARIDPNSVASIREGIEHIDRSNEAMRAEIVASAARLHSRFGSEPILGIYASALSRVLEQAKPQAVA